MPRTFAAAIPTLLLAAALCAALPSGSAYAAAQVTQAGQAGQSPNNADVLEYIRLYGYREMLELGAERQLASIIEIVRQTRDDVAPGALEAIHEELRAELHATSQKYVLEMAEVFRRRMTAEDVAYLISVGRDPRMQRVVKMQPALAADLEGVGERLGDEVAEKAAPRIEARLRKLAQGQQL